jgi:hypothetical protein
MMLSPFLRRLLQPLASRKVRVALATVLAALGAAWGLNVREDVIHTILGVGAALILGIAHEDHGRLSDPTIIRYPAARPAPPSPAASAIPKKHIPL